MHGEEIDLSVESDIVTLQLRHCRFFRLLSFFSNPVGSCQRPLSMPVLFEAVRILTNLKKLQRAHTQLHRTEEETAFFSKIKC